MKAAVREVLAANERMKVATAQALAIEQVVVKASFAVSHPASSVVKSIAYPVMEQAKSI